MKNIKKINSKTDKPKWWLCDGKLSSGKKCEAKLGRFVDKDRITIWGPNHQEYEIGFNYISIVCKKCGKRHSIRSTVPDDLDNLRKELLGKENKKTRELVEMSGERKIFSGLKTTPLEDLGLKSFFSLTSQQRDKLLNKLSVKQKEIYKILSSMEADILEEDVGRDEIIKAISKKINLPFNLTDKHILKIEKEIRKRS